MILQGVGLKVGVGVDNPEIQARLSAVEQENKELKQGKYSVPSKAICREIGPALWKIGSTDFVKIRKCVKKMFL